MHFSVDKPTAINLKTEMEQQLAGYLVPKLVQEIAGKNGKNCNFSYLSYNWLV